MPCLRFAIATLFLVGATTGCLVEVLTTTAIQGELAAQNASAASRQLSKAKESTAEITLRQGIATYYAEKGHYPPTLEALVPNWVAAVPMQPNGQPYNYDPATGWFGAGPPPAITSADRQNKQKIQNAVNQYGTAVGYYPPSLDALVTYGYLDAVPNTSRGEDFFFNPQDGTLLHPAEVFGNASGGNVAHTPRGGGVGVGGAGPLGEAMTGIAIQNELGNMGSGASQTGSRMRQGTRDQSATYSDRQMEALKKYGID